MTIQEVNLAAIREAYEQCQGQWVGCDWTTEHGATNLDLDGCDPAQLRAIADKIEDGTATDEDYDSVPQADSVEDMDLIVPIWTDDEYAAAVAQRKEMWVDDLRSGADWLEEVAGHAISSEAYGEEAMAAVEGGDMVEALKCAKRACCCESTYGDSPIWSSLRRAIEESTEDD